MEFNKVFNYIFAALFFLIITFIFTIPGFCAKKQFTPSVSITEKYTDNFHQTQNNKDDEFSTQYKAGFSFGVIDKQNSLFLEYSPQYTDYMDQDGHDSWNHTASLNAVLQKSKNTRFTFSDSFNRSLSRTVRTNSFEKHDTNTATAALNHQFGKKDSYNLSYTYTFDDYDNANQDEFKTHRPSAYLAYWFSPQFGIDLNASYSKTDYEISSDNLETLKGDLRFIKKINRHLGAYVKYAHTHTDQNTGDHVVYNPSAGLDWQPTDDSSIVIGGGVLFQKYENNSNDDSEKLFLEFDIYKNFSFSKRNNLSVTGSSSYNDIDDEASSLGFTISHRIGFLHSYKLTKKLTSEVNGSYNLSDYDEPGVDREDKTLNLGAGLNWSPLKWLKCNFSYGFTDFNTSDTTREDYQEHTASVSISVIPSESLRIKSSDPRDVLENKIFN